MLPYIAYMDPSCGIVAVASQISESNVKFNESTTEMACFCLTDSIRFNMVDGH